VKLLVMTDPHIVTPGERIIGLDPSARLAQVLDHAMERQGDADHLVILGDLTHHGAAAEYAELQRVLARVEMPVTLMLGNHDLRDGYRDAFGGEGFVQEVVALGRHRLICLDTLDEGAEPLHSGVLCAARMAWLAEMLEDCAGAPVVIAMHHPPFKTGFDGMDAIMLRNSDAFYDLITAYEGEVHLICGHVHRTISGAAYGVPYAVFKSACHQMPMMLGAAGSSHSVDEPGAYGIVLLGDEGVIVHSEDVGDFGPVTVDGHSA